MMAVLARGVLGLFWAVTMLVSYVLLVASTAVLSALGLLLLVVFGGAVGLVKLGKRFFEEWRKRSSGS